MKKSHREEDETEDRRFEARGEANREGGIYYCSKTPEIHLRFNSERMACAAVASTATVLRAESHWGDSSGYFYFDECVKKITNFLSASEPSSKKKPLSSK